MIGIWRDMNPFEREARSQVAKRLKALGLPEPDFYFGQVELKAKVDSLRELRSFADEYGGHVEVDQDYDWRRRDVKAFTVVQIEGIKVHLCAYVSDEEAEAAGLW